ncbi:MAG: RIP metalloprotease RseP [Candidatus Krumholzibacteriia bacterium]
MTSQLPTILLASVVTLGLVVIVHELGHFLFCKMFGIYVKTFSIGMGPKLVRWRLGETEYVLSAIPFGGYVKMAGEGMMEEIQDTGTWEERKYPLGTVEGNREAASLDEDIPRDRLFSERPAWQRLLVFIAGPLFNLLLAWVIYSSLFAFEGLRTDPFTRVGEVRDGSPAELAGFAVGDSIVAVGGQPVAGWDDVLQGLVPEANRAARSTPAVPVTVVRDGQRLELELAPRFDAEAGVWSVGLETWNTTVGRVQKGGPAEQVGLQQGDMILTVDGQTVTSFAAVARIVNDKPDQPVEVRWRRGGEVMHGMVTPENKEVEPGRFLGRIFIEPMYAYERLGVGEAASLGWRQTTATITGMVTVLGQLFGGQHGLDAVGGPLRIGQAAGEMLRWGVSHLMYFIAFFSVNLFLLNLMPVPVLDGGHVLFLLLEVARGGRPVPERIQAIATQMGLIVLLLFMTFVVVLDVWKVTGH